MKKGVMWINMMAIMLVLALMASAVPVGADDGLRSGFSKVRDWDKVSEGFSFVKAITDSSMSMYGGAIAGGGDFFISPRGIHVFDAPGIIDMGVIYLDTIGEAPASGYVDMVTPIDGHSYVVRSNGKYGKFYLEETYDWLDPIEYGFSWVYQTNGTRTFEGAATPSEPATTLVPTVTGGAYECPQDLKEAYQQYIAAYNKLTYLMAEHQGDTPQAQAAYEDYVVKKACWEARESGTEIPSTTTTTTTTTTPGTTTTTPWVTTTTPGTTTTTPGTTTTTSGATGSSGQGMGYPPSQWIPHQNGQGKVNVSQNEICISSMDTGGAWAEAQRSYGIAKDYTVELDFMVREQNNHFIEIFCDEYVFLAVDWGTSVVYHQPGSAYSLGQLPIGLEVNRWYRIRMDAHPAQGTYDIYVDNNKLATATGIFPPDMGHHYRNDPSRQTQAGNLIYIGDVDDVSYKGGNYDRGSACWRNISITIPESGATAQPTPTSTPALTGTALIAQSRTVAPGGTIWIPLSLRNFQNVASLGFHLSYDPAVVQVTQVTKGSLLAATSFTSNTQQPGRIIFGFAGTRPVSGDGSAAIVVFKAVGAEGSTCALTLSQIEATDTSGATVSVTPVNGQLTIGKVMVGDGNGDGKINVFDALMALNMYVQLRAENLILDMNQDGRVNPEDARLIMELAKPK